MEGPETGVIQVASGPCLARRQEGLVIARGIPYARAERFHRPDPVPSWNATKDCTRPAKLCPQNPSRLEAVLGPITANREHDEDCLHLTVVAPEKASDAPVTVFLHGGAFISGGGDLDCYLPLNLARQGIVAVNITYRLGVFGYLALPGIAPANLGLLDQIMALRWIQRNISSFGGNPANVTIAGQSAGAESIVCLLASTGTEGLFHRAILMSNPGTEIRDRASTTALLSEKAQSLLTDDPRKMSVSQLLELQKSLLMNPVKSHIMLFGPALGHDPLPPESELDKRLNARIAKIPMLIGWTTQDGRPFARMMGPMRTWYSTPILGGMLEAMGVWYVTDRYFAAPAKALDLQTRAQPGGQSATYTFGWFPPGNPLQANHCIDIPFILGDLEAWRDAPMLAGWESRRADFDSVSRHLQQLWIGFASGKPLKPGHITINSGFCSDALWQ